MSEVAVEVVVGFTKKNDQYSKLGFKVGGAFLFNTDERSLLRFTKKN